MSIQSLEYTLYTRVYPRLQHWYCLSKFRIIYSSLSSSCKLVSADVILMLWHVGLVLCLCIAPIQCWTFLVAGPVFWNLPPIPVQCFLSIFFFVILVLTEDLSLSTRLPAVAWVWFSGLLHFDLASPVVCHFGCHLTWCDHRLRSNRLLNRKPDSTGYYSNPINRNQQFIQ